MGKSRFVTDSGFENYDTASEAISGVGAGALPELEDGPVAVEYIQPELPADEPVIRAEISGFDFITRARAEAIVKNRAVLAAGLGIVPVPAFAFVSATAVQITMVQSITRLYNIEVKKSWIKNIILSVVGGGAAVGLSGVVAKSLAAAPLVGTSLAILSGPALNGLTTYAIGYMFIRYFESGDGLLKANAKALGNWFKEGFKEGRERLGDVVAGKAQTA